MQPEPGTRWRNLKKGDLYKVIAIATHSETEELLVVYQSVTQPNSVWARPLSMWYQKFVEAE